MGWSDRQWYVTEPTSDGILVKMVDAPPAAQAIYDLFAASLDPLGDGRARGHNQYVSRWRHKSGAVLVSENGQPNVWMTKESADRIGILTILSGAKMFLPGDENPGFHSNVAATPGLNGEVVVKFRADNSADAQELASKILYQLEIAS